MTGYHGIFVVSPCPRIADPFEFLEGWLQAAWADFRGSKLVEQEDLEATVPQSVSDSFASDRLVVLLHGSRPVPHE
jgi:hypothetical protein